LTTPARALVYNGKVKIQKIKLATAIKLFHAMDGQKFVSVSWVLCPVWHSKDHFEDGLSRQCTYT